MNRTEMRQIAHTALYRLIAKISDMPLESDEAPKALDSLDWQEVLDLIESDPALDSDMRAEMLKQAESLESAYFAD